MPNGWTVIDPSVISFNARIFGNVISLYSTNRSYAFPTIRGDCDDAFDRSFHNNGSITRIVSRSGAVSASAV